MKLLKEITRKQGLNYGGRMLFREAVRGVILKDRTLLMIYAAKDEEYIFPGGGVDAGETYEDALAREIYEECGARLLSVKGEIGKVIEYDKPDKEGYDVFNIISYFYLCDVEPDFGVRSGISPNYRWRDSYEDT